jgi:hypothetical protein
MTRGPRPIGEPSRVPYRPLNTTAAEASGGPGPQTAPANPPPNPRMAARKTQKAVWDAKRRAYPVPIGVPGSPRHEFRSLRQSHENALLSDLKFEKKYGLGRGTSARILGPQSGERNAGTQGVSEENRNSIRDNGGPDIGFTPKGYLDRRRKSLIAAAAAEVPRAEAAGDGPAKRPRLDTGLHNEPSTSHSFMPYQDPFAWQYRHDEPVTSPPFTPYQDSPLRPINLAENSDTRLVSPPSPDSRALPPFGERPGAWDRPAAAPQGGGSRSPSPDPQLDVLLQSFNEY